MAYIGNSPGVSSQRIVNTFTATAGQTTFTPSSGYTVGYVDVYLNGIKLVNGTDYTASNGSTVVLTETAAADDVVEVMAYIPRGMSDGYTKSEADARYMDINAVTLPDQSGHSGQFLQTDGSNADWATVDLTQFDAPVQLKNYTTTQRNALTGLDPGDTIYNSTTGSIEFYDGSKWIATNLIPTVNSVTGTIYAGAASTLTLSLTNATDTVTVRFSEGGSTVADVDDVSVTSGSASVSVPAAVYGQTAGDTISVSVLNSDGTPSSNGISKTAQGLPTGGTITTSGSYRIHTFTSSSSFVVPSGLSLSNVEYLVVAGGGGGAHGAAGGGGAGGYRSSVVGESSGGGSSAESRLTLSANSYAVTIGAGGGAGGGTGGSGGNSVFGSITATGGGGGGIGNASSGGSGGGSGYQATVGFAASGTSGQGYAGGTSGYQSPYYPPAGGGGAGAVGQSPSSGSDAGAQNGGAGVQSSINGTATYRAGGGGASGSNQGASAGAGGNGGGGAGSAAGAAAAGTANTGGGGGGTHDGSAAAGGSGIVIVRYQL
jgi:hypothetical protein